MSNVTLAARLAGDTAWSQIPVARVAGCDHQDSICSGCRESWELDWEFEAGDVDAAITAALQFGYHVALVRSLSATVPFGELLDGMRTAGLTEKQISEVLAEAAAEPVEDAAPVAPASELSLWTLTRIDPLYTVQEGDFHEMMVVAQDPAAARQWAYREAVRGNKPEPRVWLDADEFALRILHADDVPADTMTGVTVAEVWTVEKMGNAPLSRERAQ